MKHLFYRLLYGIEYVFIILFYMISFIFSWMLALIVIPLLIAYWFILKLYNRHPKPLSSMIRIKRRDT